MPEKQYFEEYIFSKLPFDPEAETIHVEHFFDSTWQGGYGMTGELQKSVIYSLILKGRAVCTTGDQRAVEVHEKMFYSTAMCGSGHRTWKVPKGEIWQRKSICVRRTPLHDLLEQRLLAAFDGPMELHEPARVEAILDDFRNILKQSLPDPAVLSGMFLRLVCEVLAQQNPVQEPAVLKAGEAYIRRHFARHEITVEAIASAAGASGRTLSRIFRTCRNCTPMEMVWHLRLEHAALLLIHTGDPVKTIADRCGFSGANFMIRQFRKKYGLTPLEYRRTHGRRPELRA